MDGANYKAKVKEAKFLKQFGLTLKRLYIEAKQCGDHERAESFKQYMIDTKELLDKLEIYKSNNEKEYSVEEINELLDNEK